MARIPILAPFSDSIQSQSMVRVVSDEEQRDMCFVAVLAEGIMMVVSGFTRSSDVVKIDVEITVFLAVRFR